MSKKDLIAFLKDVLKSYPTCTSAGLTAATTIHLRRDKVEEIIRALKKRQPPSI